MDIIRVAKTDRVVPVRNVLVSVADKRDLETIVEAVVAANPKSRFYSTGGTFARLAEILGEDSARLTSVSDYTGQPETKGGLVKTLDFKIYLGILTETYNSSHQSDLARTGAIAFDMVIVNLYPFQNTIGRVGCDAEDARGNIDIGGPCMLRAAAKNFLRCAAVSDPSDYARLAAELSESGGKLSFETRLDLSKKAFHYTAGYDAAIAEYLAGLDASEVMRLYEMGVDR